MHYQYRCKGTCSQLIDFDIDGDIITNISFYGGCNGNLKAIALLLEGKDADYIISTLIVYFVILLSRLLLHVVKHNLS